MKILFSFALALLITSSLVAKEDPPTQSFGRLPDGETALLFTLRNANGMTVQVSNFGATLVSVKVPDRKGKLEEVTLGFDSAAEYLAKTNPNFGATVGRFGNRIAHGRFTLDGKEYHLLTNNAPGGLPCHLHGGKLGFNRRLWKVDAASSASVQLSYVSRAGEEGYPGTLSVQLIYSLNEANELRWDIRATTDEATVINLVHHPYWNLSGQLTKPITDHLLQLPASHYLPTNAGLIPTGERAKVAGTPMDFREPKRIGEDLEKKFTPLLVAGGYDHAWILNRSLLGNLKLAAKLIEPQSGRVLTLHTNQPAVQFYGGNFLNGKLKGRGGVTYPYRSALCLEPEGFPDAPNHPDFPSTTLRPGDTYRNLIIYSFTTE